MKGVSVGVLMCLVLLGGVLGKEEGVAREGEDKDARCLNLNPYEPVLNGLLNLIPGREIQDLLPLPFSLNDGEEVWSLKQFIGVCFLELSLDQVNVQVMNINFEKLKMKVSNKERISIELPFGVQLSLRFKAKCGLYRPKVTAQLGFAATMTSNMDTCIDVKALTDPTNILKYTYGTFSDFSYKANIQKFNWCTEDALPVLKSVIDSVIENNLDTLWTTIDALINQAVLPIAEQVLNGVLRAIGIPPYDQAQVGVEKIFQFPPLRKQEEKSLVLNSTLSVLQTSNFTKVFDDKKSGAWMDVTFFRPTSIYSNYYPIGDYAQDNHNSANGKVMMVLDDASGLVAKPQDYKEVWNTRGMSLLGDDGSLWKPVPPPGYVALGHVANKGYRKPSTNLVRVVREECVVRCDPWLVWTDKCSSAWNKASVWQIDETTSPSHFSFISSSDRSRPSSDSLLCLSPKCLTLHNL